MLNNTGQQNLSCTFAEQTAAYLYDEIGDTEKLGFESHLHDCRICADELADFSVLHSTIAEWREISFEPLSSPAFVLPFADKAAVQKHSWFEPIRAYFNFSPTWSTAAFVALLMFGGLFWFAANYSRRIELANNQTTRNPAAVPTVETLSGNRTNAPIDDAATASSQLSKSTPGAAKTATVKNTVVPVKISAKPATLPKSDKSIVPNRVKENQPAMPVKNNVPAINGDDDEDNSPRLSDLLEEVGMNKSSEESND